jgi:hypothetical protein
VRCRHFTLRRSSCQAQEDAAQLNAFLQQVSVFSMETSSDETGCWSVLVFYEERYEDIGAAESGAVSVNVSSLDSEERGMLARLRAWRQRRAHALQRPPELLVDDDALAMIAHRYMSLPVADGLAHGPYFEDED